MSPANNQEEKLFQSLLEFLREYRGFDFTGYKPSSLKRRITKQMQTHQIDSYGDYRDYLEVHPEEFYSLFNTILINVTAFFRDQQAWQYLQQEVIPSILAEKAEKSPFRVWSAGCASGEEAYTLAMLLVEELGEEKFRQRVKIYATDIDEEALQHARQACYSQRDLEAVPELLQQRYFEKIGNQLIFRNDLRRSIIFGRHDLLQDAPISRLDLLVCRCISTRKPKGRFSIVFTLLLTTRASSF